MKVNNIIIYNDFGYLSGGAAKVAIDMAIGLSNKGYNVIFFCGTGPIDNELKTNVKQVICLHQPDMLSDKNKLNAAIRSIWNNKAYKKTLLLLSKFSADDTVVIVHGFSKTLSSSIFSAFKKSSFKIILILHDYFAACPNGGFYNYKRQKVCKLKPLSIKCLFCNCDARNYSQKIYRCIRQVFVDHNLSGNVSNLNGYNVSGISKNIQEKFIKSKFHIFSTLLNPVDVNEQSFVDIRNNKYYLFIGRLSKEKGIIDFCRVITELNLKAIVVGDGYLKTKLKKKYPNIVFVGWKQGGEKEKIIKLAKCLVFPSRWYETFGLVVPEILSYGIPCIVPNGCGSSELISDGVNGYVFEIDNYFDLKAKISQFEKTNLSSIMQTTRNSFQRENFSIKKYVDNLLHIIKCL